jgi:hypothetical protein
MKIKKVMGAVLALAMALSLVPTVEARASIFDEMNAATSVEFEENVSGTIDSVDDADWYKFKTTDYAANYTISMSNLDESGSWKNTLQCRVYDGDGNCLYTYSYSSQKNGTENYKFEPKKTYYLQFSHYYTSEGSFYSAYEYALKVSCEKEEPDSRETATKISANQSYTGQIFTKSDEDWFRFTTPKYNMIYSIQASNLYGDSWDNYVGYRVYDADKNCIFDKYLKKLENNTSELTLAAGKTYYIQFYSYMYYKSPYNYSFKVNAADISSIDPPATYVSAVSKGFMVKWDKVTNANGYEIRYSTKKNMKNAKTVTLTGKSKKITKLKAKTKYYVQVRAYAKLSTGKKLYSKWSVKKTVTTKK